MNLIQHTVTKVRSTPYFNYMWCVDVEVDCWGNISNSTVYCSTIEEALEVKEGYSYEA